jgi:hypothetical protein
MIFNPFAIFTIMNNNINNSRRTRQSISTTTFREILLFNKEMYNKIINASSNAELYDIKQEIKNTTDMFKNSNIDEMDLNYLNDCVKELYNDIKNKII